MLLFVLVTCFKSNISFRFVFELFTKVSFRNSKYRCRPSFLFEESKIDLCSLQLIQNVIRDSEIIIAQYHEESAYSLIWDFKTGWLGALALLL